MTVWPTAALGDIFEIARGGSPRPIDDFITDDSAGVNWVMIGDATAGSKYISSTKKRIRPEGAQRSRHVKPGDFLLTHSMSFGKPYIIRTEGCIHDGWLVLSPRSGDVDADFFYYLLGSRAVYAEFERRASGATVKNLNIETVRGVTVPLPPLPEQRRIAAILGKADALQAKRRAALAKLYTLTQSIFLDMFGDPATNPKGWPTCNVGNYVAEFQGGKSIEADANGKGATRHRVLKVSAVTGMQFQSGESKPIPDTYSPPEAHFVRPGDLLFSRANTTELVGAVAFVRNTPSNLLLPDKLWRFVWCQPVRAEPLFVWMLFQSAAMRDQIQRRATGTSGSMKNISQGKVLDISSILPPLDLQKEFVRRLTATNALREREEASLASTDELFASLQHRALRGEL